AEDLHEALGVAFEDGEVVADESERIVNLVRHAGGEQADGGELFVLKHDGAHAVALGQVAHGGEELQRLATVSVGRIGNPSYGFLLVQHGECDLDGEIGAVLASALDLDDTAEDAWLPRGDIAGQAALVQAAVVVRDQHADRLADDLGRLIAEHALGGGIEQGDDALL